MSVRFGTGLRCVTRLGIAVVTLAAGLVIAVGTNPRIALAAPTLVIDKRISASTADAGDTLNYTIRFRCGSLTENCTGVQVTDTLNSLFTIADYSKAGGLIAGVTKTGNALTWSMVDPLPAGSTGLVAIRVVVPTCAATQPANPITNSAAISGSNAASSSDGTDADVTVAALPTCTTTGPPPSISEPFRKQGSAVLPEPGGLAKWSIAVPVINPDGDTNTPASAFIVEDTIPSGTLVTDLFVSDAAYVDCGAGWSAIPGGLSLAAWVSAGSFPGASGCTRQLVPLPGNTTVYGINNVVGLRGYYSSDFTVRSFDTAMSVQTWVPLTAAPGAVLTNCATYSDASGGGTGALGTALHAPVCDSMVVQGRPTVLNFKRIIASPGVALQEPQLSDPSWGAYPYPVIAESAAQGIVMGPTDLAYSLRSQALSSGPGLSSPVVSELLDPNLQFVAPVRGGANWWRANVTHRRLNGQAYPVGTNPQQDPRCTDPMFEVIDDFEGTGRQLVRWTFAGCQLVAAPYEFEPLITVYFSVSLKPGISAGIVIRNNFQLGSTEQVLSNAPFQCVTTVTPTSDTYENPWISGYDDENLDVLDRDGDGDRSEYACRSTVVDFPMPAMSSVDSSKWVKGSLDTELSRFPLFGETDVSGAAVYELNLTNKGNTSLSQLDLIDVLPHPGDASVIDIAANGTPTSRLSDWGEELVSFESVQRQTGASATFTTIDATDLTLGFSASKNPCRWNPSDPNETNRLVAAGGVFASNASVTAPAGCENPAWSAIASGARSWALRYIPTVPLGPGDSLRIRLRVRVAPGEAPTAPLNQKVAWNSFGFAGTTTAAAPNDVLLSTEPIKVGVRMVDVANTASLGDYVWIDANHDGIQNDGGNGVAGVTVSLFSGATKIDTTRTDSSGFYRFDGLTPNATYQVQLDNVSDFQSGGVLGGYVLTTANATADTADSDAAMVSNVATIATAPTAGAGSMTPTYDFGFWLPASLGDYVWEDLDANGAQDIGEPGVAGVTVVLHNAANDATIATQLTDGSGYYLFADLVAGAYYVVFDTATAVGNGADSNPYSGYGYTAPDGTGGEANDSDADSFGRSAIAALVSGQHDPTWDAGLVAPRAAVANPASLGDFTWVDLDGDGQQDGAEPALAGVTVILLTSMGFPLESTTTDANGLYQFTNLDPLAGWQLRFIAPPSYRLTTKDSTSGGTTNINDSDATAGNGYTDPVAPIGADTHDPTWDAGFIPTYSLGNVVWLDTNDNGLRDLGSPTERGIADVAAALYAGDGSTEIPVGPDGRLGTVDDAAGGVRTNASGHYLFSGLPAGDYVVAATAPAGYLSSVGNGSDPASAGPYEGVAVDEDTTAVDNDDNGSFHAASGTIRSAVVTLSYGAEPLGEQPTPGWADASPSANNNYQLDFGLLQGYDLALAKVANVAQVTTNGETINWTIRVQNQGAFASGDYTVTDTLPAGLGAPSSISDGGVAAGNTLTWNLSDLQPGTFKDVTYSTAVGDITAGPFRNWAEISLDSGNDTDSTADANTGNGPTAPNDLIADIPDLAVIAVNGIPLADEDDNDVAVVTVPVITNPVVTNPVVTNPVVYDLALAKILKPGQILTSNDDVVYQLLVKNQGNVASQAFTVIDVIPTGMAYVSASNGGTALGRQVTWRITNLAPNATVTLELTVSLSNAQLGSYTNWAEITEDSAVAYGAGARDKDSTPDTNIGADGTPPNDLLVDQTNADSDTVVGDEDDNDLVTILGSDVTQLPPPPPTTPTGGGLLPATGVMIVGVVVLAGLLILVGWVLLGFARRRDPQTLG